MIDTHIAFSVDKRPNRFSKSGTEWALNARLIGKLSNDYWTMKTWSKKPTEKEVDEVKDTILLAFKFYHCHLQLPHFQMEVIDDVTQREQQVA